MNPAVHTCAMLDLRSLSRFTNLARNISLFFCFLLVFEIFAIFRFDLFGPFATELMIFFGTNTTNIFICNSWCGLILRIHTTIEKQ